MGSGTVQGVARNVHMRAELRGGSGNTHSTVVCNFRVEVHNRKGNPVRLYPVEMRGDSFEGAVNERDWVRAQGTAKHGTLRVRRLQNLTTGAQVSARTTPVTVILLVAALFVAWLVFIFVMATR